jgi:hypothetical protein
LDRGLRNAVKELKQTYNLNTKMPTCNNWFIFSLNNFK